MASDKTSCMGYMKAQTTKGMQPLRKVLTRRVVVGAGVLQAMLLLLCTGFVQSGWFSGRSWPGLSVSFCLAGPACIKKGSEDNGVSGTGSWDCLGVGTRPLRTVEGNGPPDGHQK